MKLEDAKKEELIWWIRKNIDTGSYWRYTHYDENDIVREISLERMQKLQEEERILTHKYIQKNDEYLTLLKRYQGQSLSAVPKDVLQKLSTLAEEMKKLVKKQQKVSAEWEKACKGVDGV